MSPGFANRVIGVDRERSDAPGAGKMLLALSNDAGANALVPCEGSRTYASTAVVEVGGLRVAHGRRQRVADRKGLSKVCAP